MKKIIILGSSGSIGSYLCQKLSSHFKIIATVRKESDLEMINDKNNITALKVDFKKNIYYNPLEILYINEIVACFVVAPLFHQHSTIAFAT